jgi:hypothetical protein
MKGGSMWYWLFVGVSLIAVALGMFERLFWWSVAGIGVLWTTGIIVEVFSIYRQDKELSGEAKRANPARRGSTSGNNEFGDMMTGQEIAFTESGQSSPRATR